MLFTSWTAEGARVTLKSRPRAVPAFMKQEKIEEIGKRCEEVESKIETERLGTAMKKGIFHRQIKFNPGPKQGMRK